MNRSHRVALIALLGLAALQVLWYGWWAPPVSMDRKAAIALALVGFALPLLAARADAGRGLLVAALLCLGYFSHGVMEAWANPRARLPALAEILLAAVVILFAGWPSWQGARARKRARLDQARR